MRLIVLIYSMLSYFTFFIVLTYFIGFVGDIFVPKAISTQPETYSSNALVINIGLLLMWGIQHSVMARGWFKNLIAKVVPHHVERSTYVLVSAITLVALMLYWQPMEGTVWQFKNEWIQQLMWSLFGLGWGLSIISTFLTDHFDLFGLRQAWLHFVKTTYTAVPFSQHVFYRWIRHPMMLGMLIAFWATPVMHLDHLVFSLGMSAYILIGIHFEEKGLAHDLGEAYRAYQKKTKKVIPAIY